jgi:hypothetical protein
VALATFREDIVSRFHQASIIRGTEHDVLMPAELATTAEPSTLLTFKWLSFRSAPTPESNSRDSRRREASAGAFKIPAEGAVNSRRARLSPTLGSLLWWTRTLCQVNSPT